MKTDGRWTFGPWHRAIGDLPTVPDALDEMVAAAEALQRAVRAMQAAVAEAQRLLEEIKG